MESAGFAHVLDYFLLDVWARVKAQSQHLEMFADTGMDLITSAFESHEYGHLLGRERSMVLAVMRFSQVLASPHGLKGLFLEKFGGAFAGLRSSYAMADRGKSHYSNFK